MSAHSESPDLRVVWNAVYLSLGEIVARGVNAGVGLILARHLGAEQYGAFNVALAVGVVAGSFTDIGLTEAVMRESTRPGSNVAQVLGASLKLRLGFAIVSTGVAPLIIANL